MKKAVIRILGALTVLLGMGDVVARGTVFRQMFGGVIIIMGILLFILAEVCEINEYLRRKTKEEV